MTNTHPFNEPVSPNVPVEGDRVYQFPEIVSNDIPVDEFLERGRLAGVSSIDILLVGYETHPVTERSITLVEIPLGVKYEGRDSDRGIVLTRRVEFLASAYYNPTDTDLQHSLGLFPKPRPWERLDEYGRACAEYCASKGFDATVYLKGPNSQGCGSRLHVVTPADVKGKEGLILPSLTIA